MDSLGHVSVARPEMNEIGLESTCKGRVESSMRRGSRRDLFSGPRLGMSNSEGHKEARLFVV